MKQELSEKNSVKLRILPVVQNIGPFFVAVADASDVIDICSAQERKLDALEKYIGVQRPLNEERVKEIKKYVETSDASFPNSIILSLNPEMYSVKGDFIYIKRDKSSANIIDGQHRLSGFSKNSKGFQLILTLFPELEFEEQSYLFSVINTKMTRINPALSQDLYEFATVLTPEKLAHNIAKTLNTTSDSVWFEKIKMLGRREGIVDAVLSQSTFSKGIISLICDKKNSYEIRDILKRNKNNRLVLKSFYSESKAKTYIFWDKYVLGEEKFIYDSIKWFFLSVKNNFPTEWNDNKGIMTKTTGYLGLIKVLKYLIKYFNENKIVVSLEEFDKCLSLAKVNLNGGFNSNRYPPGGIGERKLYLDFISAMPLNKKSR